MSDETSFNVETRDYQTREELKKALEEEDPWLELVEQQLPHTGRDWVDHDLPRGKRRSG